MSDRESINPYPGTAPFQDRKEDRLIFFGRDREITRLTDLILSEPLVILFARSGLGKSSLINAGVVEQLRANDCFPIVARVSHNLEAGPIVSIFDRIDEELRKHGISSSSNPDESSLWAYFEGVRFSRGDRELKPVLILDQFEELFTRLLPAQRTTFIDQFADIARGRVPQAVRNAAIAALDKMHDEDPENAGQAGKPAAGNDARQVEGDTLERDRQRERLLALAYGGIDLDVKIVLSMREDFLAELEALKDRIPQLLRNTMRLEPLTRAQAEDAIIKPSQQGELLGTDTVRIEPDAVKAMLDFLSGQQTEQLIKGDDIEPVQLQILCHSLYESARQRGDKTIAVKDLGGQRGMAHILRSYYNKVVNRFPRFRSGWNARGLAASLSNLYIFNLPRHAIRTLCEDGLILGSGFRNSLEGGYIGAAYGVPEGDLVELVDQRLLRSEARQHGRFYELSHDSLIEILKRNRVRRRIWTAAATVAIAVLVICSVVVAQIGIQTVWLHVLLSPLKQTIVKGDDRERAGALDRYRELTPVLDLSETSIANLRFRESLLRPSAFERVSFAKATLKTCTFSLLPRPDQNALVRRTGGFYRYSFKDAKIDEGVFSLGTITGADFSGTRISDTKFDSTRLSSVSFRNATLADVDFSDASLSDNENSVLSSVDFLNAKLAGVSFKRADLRGVEFSGAQLNDTVDFTEAQWWMARGWSDDQLKQLESKFPHRAFAGSVRYGAEFTSRMNRVTEARDRSAKDRKDNGGNAGNAQRDFDNAQRGLARALNEVAWYRAMHGQELPTAQQEIDEALSILADPARQDPRDAQDIRSMRDTKAYILMQQGDFGGAKGLLALAVGANLSVSVDIPPSRVGEVHPAIIYKYALTLRALGEEAAAKAAFGLTTYQPTHERLLVSMPVRRQ